MIDYMETQFCACKQNFLFHSNATALLNKSQLLERGSLPARVSVEGSALLLWLLGKYALQKNSNAATCILAFPAWVRLSLLGIEFAAVETIAPCLFKRMNQTAWGVRCRLASAPLWDLFTV